MLSQRVNFSSSSSFFFFLQLSSIPLCKGTIPFFSTHLLMATLESNEQIELTSKIETDRENRLTALGRVLGGGWREGGKKKKKRKRKVVHWSQRDLEGDQDG